jgi:hypothetical protein
MLCPARPIQSIYSDITLCREEAWSSLLFLKQVRRGRYGAYTGGWEASMDMSHSFSADSREERVLINPFLASDASPEPQLWRLQAACASTDPDLFFPEKSAGWQTVVQAKKICLGCPVLIDCRAHAIKNKERFGVWGGMSERELRQARRVHV